MSRAPNVMFSFQDLGLFVQPGGHVHVVAARQDVDDRVVLDVGDGRGVVGAASRNVHEGGLVESDGSGLVQALSIGGQEGVSIGGHGIVDRVPVTGEFGRHLFDRASVADLARGPLRGPGRQQAVLGRDAVVREHPAGLGARSIGATHSVLFPAQAHRRPIDGQVDIAHHGTVLDPGRPSAGSDTTPGVPPARRRARRQDPGVRGAGPRRL